MSDIPELTSKQGEDLMMQGLVKRVERKLTYRTINGWKTVVPGKKPVYAILIGLDGNAIGTVSKK